MFLSFNLKNTLGLLAAVLAYLARGLLRLLGTCLLALLPLLLTAALFLAVLRSGEPAPLPRTTFPSEPHRPEVCTWDCHNHGCRHAPRLPGWLGGDRGLYGRTIVGLRHLGAALLPGQPRQGYGLANLLVFCVAWPGVMWGLYWVAVRQRRELWRLRRALR